jgi:glycosyltransferase involved in cell wall biosynthesis
MSVTVLIPALNPSAHLVGLVQELVGSDQVRQVIVVNDGSSAEHDSVFQQVASQPKVLVLRHAVNLGKGAALRMGMNHFYCQGGPEDVLVTADADGQHRPQDILKVAEKGGACRDDLVLGVRSFAADVPLRSRFGNTLTHWIFRLLVGKNVQDTQTGLRAIPKSMIPALLKAKASGYEFELEMLVQAVRDHVTLISVPIETVYIEGNQSSHFRPLVDSMRVYFVFVRFLASSGLTAIIDFAVFSIAFQITHSITWGIVCGRLVAGTANFTINKSYVFHSRVSLLKSLSRYALLVAALGAIAYASILLLTERFGWNAYLSKIFVEGLLLVGSFVLQRDVVFSKQPLAPADEAAPSTDWDSYYTRPYSSAKISRRFTGALLQRLLRRYSPPGPGSATLVELGGANSCFYDELRTALHPAAYDVVDNNKIGLQAFRSKVPAGVASAAHEINVLSDDVQQLKERYDMCFSVGLVEHFDKASTARAIAAHFEMLRPGGVALITYPTPTFLYRATRWLAEATGQWIFWDERPLQRSEVAETVSLHGEILHEEINWWIFLTQGVIVARKHGKPEATPP